MRTQLLVLAAFIVACRGPVSDPSVPSAAEAEGSGGEFAIPAPTGPAAIPLPPRPAGPLGGEAPEPIELADGEPAAPGIEAPSLALVAQLRAAIDDHGADYEPRTHHFEDDGSPTFVNRLIMETSPYLLQHAHNPVNWRPWGDEAFETAAALERPVLLSVGYSTCHWCHVMERESFEDLEIAAFINANFVPIKVDREERPDVDGIYMNAVYAIAGRGGWPMTVVMTPDREPFFAGTYFPARTGDRGSREGFLSILQRLSTRYQSEPDSVVSEARQITRSVRARSNRPARGRLTEETLDRSATHIVATLDEEWGGFGHAPKFPRPSVLTFLMRHALRTGDGEALHAVTLTLDRMSEGGMYDHVGGGFHRYSVDRFWLVPHFEKMLYDNAQLVMAYIEAYQLTGDVTYERVARETLHYISRDLTGAFGEFWSATDADSSTPDGHSEEGWFFTWTPNELRGALDPEVAEAISAYYGVTARGNFEHRNIFSTRQSADEVAAGLGIETEELDTRIQAGRQTLYELRETRPHPVLDDKIIAAWNGLMISAFARAGVVLQEPAYVDRAVAAAEFVRDRMVDEQGVMHRTFRAGRPAHAGVLDDYAFFGQACLDLFEATGDRSWLSLAIQLQEQLESRFSRTADGTNTGPYYLTPSDGPELLAREVPAYDGAEPSGNSVAALNLLRLGELTLDQRWRQRAENLMGSARQDTSAPLMLTALDWFLDTPMEIGIVVPTGTNPAPLLAELRGRFVPNRALVIVEESTLESVVEFVPWLEGKRALNGAPTAYVCEEGVCELPTADPVEFGRQVDRRIER